MAAANGQANLTSDPAKIRIVTSDIPNFWAMYAKLEKASTKEEGLKIIESEYLNKGSLGLREYVRLSNSNPESFWYAIEKHKKLLSSLRVSTPKIENYRKSIVKAARKLKKIYPEAVFPDIYFVMGRFEVGGSQFDNLLYIGAELTCLADDAPLDDLGELKSNVGFLKNIANATIHETLHYQQQNKEPVSNLEGALIEGGAEFVAYKLTGITFTTKIAALLTPAQIKEIEAEFFAEKDAPINPYWFIAKYDAARKRPAPLGYLIGFKICEGYYNRATDKKAALREIIKMAKNNEIQKFYK